LIVDGWALKLAFPLDVHVSDEVCFTLGTHLAIHLVTLLTLQCAGKEPEDETYSRRQANSSTQQGGPWISARLRMIWSTRIRVAITKSQHGFTLRLAFTSAPALQLVYCDCNTGPPVLLTANQCSF
jgi:hypothetical protein